MPEYLLAGDIGLTTGPGGVVDELSRLTQTPPEVLLVERIKPMSLQKRLIDPEEIAEMAVYLASDEARGITGQAINVCGGTVFH
jgi:NAD(P)-dependent dehydrogenase (short-subunit alcohol dehydrogenase family)